MITALKRYLRRQKVARINNELARVRALRMSMTMREFALRGQLAKAEALL